ncbi:MAG: TIGR04282 family arsenosugar biosynthesis glycosyltransferase [Betaproteobacteria bacterium]
MQRRFTRDTVRIAEQARLGSVTIWCTPDPLHRFFRALERTADVQCRTQIGDDLGQRMLGAFEHDCAHGPLLLIGTDCPMLTAEHLRDAANCLLEGDHAVFLPTEDGGYGLIGLQRPLRALFDGIQWSTARVMTQTRERLRSLRAVWREPAILWDVDRPEDLPRLAALWKPGR